MLLDLDQVVVDVQGTSASMEDNASLEDEKARFLGKSGVLTDLLKGLGKFDPETHKTEGTRVNQVKSRVEETLTARRQALVDALMNARLATEAIDVTLPGCDVVEDSLHPVMSTWERIAKIFGSIGFDMAGGPEIESDWMNFTALNNPDGHPTRSIQDTFYIDGRDSEDKLLLLRTHTNPMQVRYARIHVRKHKHLDRIPLTKVIASGRTYRVDSDTTHSPMFHQVEGLRTANNISFADLKGVYTDFLRNSFERDDIQVHFRPSYFPFTEPSAEIDMAFGNSKWLEVSGSSQVHPTVVHNVGLDPERYIGFAFGSNLERLAILRYGTNNLRLFFEDDVRFLRQLAQAPSARTSTSSPR